MLSLIITKNPSTIHLGQMLVGLGCFLLLAAAGCKEDTKPKLPGTPNGPVITDTAAVPYRSPKDSLVKKQRMAAFESSDYSGIYAEAVYDSTSLWGYNVFGGKKLLITQKNIPGMPGNKGFTTKANAIKTGNFVAWKLINNIFPPSVSKAELDSLKVL